MDVERIQQDLNRRFAAPLPEFYARRIIFWYDDDRQFEDQIDDIALDNAKVIKLTGSNNFAVKKLLASEDKTSNYLVYSPVHYDKPEENWLLNIELYSEEFRADLNSIWMDEVGLPSTSVIREQVKGYRKFFNSKERRAKFSALNKDINDAWQLHLTVLSVICGVKDPQPANIIRAVLSAGLDNESNKLYQDLISYNAYKPFWAIVGRLTGYSEGEESSLKQLACHILLTGTTRTLSEEYLKGLDGWIAGAYQIYCYDFITEWLHSPEIGRLYDIARYIEEELRIPQRLNNLDVDDLVGTECFPCVNEVILIKMMNEISDHIINVSTIKSVVEKRRTMVWYSDVACYYEGLVQIANMQEFFENHSGGFHTVEPERIWQEYTKDYYRMDTYYRLFHKCFNECLKQSNPLLDDLFKSVVQKVEGLYSTWFLGSLSSNWTTACEESLEKHGRVFEVKQQTDFYNHNVKPSDQRVFVIISDAMRYEVAASLTEQLRRETQSKVEIDSCEGIFPTITKFGMAALLPHKDLTISENANGTLSVLADGVSTDAGYRDKILKAANPSSVALKYKDLIPMSKAERTALVKGYEVVYIYHDKIDETAHTSENLVFPACDDAIAEIKNMVRIITNEFGGTQIFITSDHGFLYTYSPLKEDEKIGKDSFGGKDVEYARRYAIMQKGAKPDYLIPVKFLEGKTEYDAFAPRDNIRIKMSGSGLNFVHGGASLQEMVVPIIDFHFLRNDSKTYLRNKEKYDTKPVSLSLLSASHKISNLIFSLNFYQKEAVSGNREPATFNLYFTDAVGKAVSDTVRVIADKTSSDVQERTFRCGFNLKPLKFSNKDSYYLVIEEESGIVPVVREEFQIDIAFAVDDFNFFG